MSRPTWGTPIASTGPVLTALLALLVWAPPARAQADRVAAGVGGLIFGAATGVYTTTATYVTKARAGSYIYSLGDAVAVRPESLPILVMPITGATLGATAPSDLGRAALWGAGGFVAGAGLGAALGSLIGDSSEETWAGAIIGSAVGLLAGSVTGALSGDAEETALPMELGFRIPVGAAS